MGDLPPGDRVRLRYILPFALLAHSAAAQATIHGVVHDSLGRAPLAGAIVQLVAAENPARFSRTASTDSLGKFSIADVPAGRYAAGFFHPVLDSLGLAPTVREFPVRGGDAVEINLATPSPARLRSVICGQAAPSDAGGLVIGVIRSATDRTPLANATVAGEWLDLSISSIGWTRRPMRIAATTGDNGWFALCNVPAGGMMTLLASRGPDSTAAIELTIPPEGFRRRELFVGASRTVVVRDTTSPPDSALPPRRVHYGEGRISGTVVTEVGGSPLVGARVGIDNGPSTRTNAQGEWTLGNVAAGTRTLEVRAIGYYPDRRPVDVVTAAPSVRVALTTMKAVLDTIRVTARGITSTMAAFEERKRSGLGKYLSGALLERLNSNDAMGYLRTFAGLRFGRGENGETAVVMRGAITSYCSPSVFVDGVRIPGGGMLPDGGESEMLLEDIDLWATPSRVMAVEVYMPGTVPMEYQTGMSGCGSIVIWTRR